MTTISTQQVIDYILEKISNDFNIDHTNLTNKYGLVDTIYSDIQKNIDNSKTPKKKVVRKVTKALVVETPVVVEEPVALETPIQALKKKVVRKVTKALAVEEPVVLETPVVLEIPVVLETPVQAPKKKVVRKVTKALAVEEPVTIELPKEEPKEEKVKPQPKRIIKKVDQNTNINNTLVETVKETKEEPDNTVEGCDELEENIYVDTLVYSNEDADSLEPREINGVKYYIDCSNYVYHIETQDLIGKLGEKNNNIIFLSDFHED
jgi:hypothetical protein